MFFSVLSVSYSPDGRYIASGSLDNTIKIWSADMSDNHARDANTVSRYMTIALLPGNEWLSWRPGCLYYNSSLQGDEYAAVRFENMLYPVYPLEDYRDKLKKHDLLRDIGLEQISIRARRVMLFRWEIILYDTEGEVIESAFIRPLYEQDLWRWTKHNKKWIWGSIFLILTLMLSVFLHVRRSDPLVISRQFFKKVGFKGIRRHKKGILLLYQEKDRMSGVMLNWQGMKSV